MPHTAGNAAGVNDYETIAFWGDTSAYNQCWKELVLTRLITLFRDLILFR
ncbi:MAG: hypothetical protein PVSMB5_33730 [Ktedonobacteraceae bacterium]